MSTRVVKNLAGVVSGTSATLRRRPVDNGEPIVMPSSSCGATLLAAGIDPLNCPRWAHDLEHHLAKKRPVSKTDQYWRARVLRRLNENPRERALLALAHGEEWWLRAWPESHEP